MMINASKQTNFIASDEQERLNCLIKLKLNKLLTINRKNVN